MQTETNQGGTSAEAITPRPSSTVSGAIAATAPGQLRVIKRNGTVVPFEDSKITVAITKAFLAVEGGTAAASSRIHETVAKLTELVTTTFRRRMPSGGTIHIEDIQDQVELSLMRSGEHKIARDYVIYRNNRRANAPPSRPCPPPPRPPLAISPSYRQMAAARHWISIACTPLSTRPASAYRMSAKPKFWTKP